MENTQQNKKMSPRTIHRPEDYLCDVTMNRPRAMREDFICRIPVAKRAIHVVVSYMPSGVPVSEQLSEFEMYHLLFAVAKVARVKHWKVCSINLFGYSNPTECVVQISNPSGSNHVLGNFKSLVDTEHFLNDPYYAKKGFYIRHYEPSDKKGDRNEN